MPILAAKRHFPPRLPTELATPGGPRVIAERYNHWAQTHGREPLPGLVGQTDGEITGLLFETVAESQLIQPTILYDFPTDISPLSKCRKDDPSLVERFRNLRRRHGAWQRFFLS